MSDQKTLYTDDGIAIPWLEKRAEDFINKTTFIFGGSGSGKTTIIEEILYLCRKVPNFLVIAPETSATVYKKKLPERCVKSDLSKKLLTKVWKRQEDLTRCCNMSKDIRILEQLFKRLQDRQSTIMIRAANASASRHIEETRRRTDIDFGQKKAHETNIEASRIRCIRDIYYQAIRNGRHMLENQNLTLDEAIALDYLETDPRLMIVIDDCSEQFSKWMAYFKKGEVNIFEQILFRGRWNNVSLVCVSHDDKLIRPELRKGARITIFTTKQAIVSYANKAQGGFTTKEKKEVMKLADKIFGDEEHGIRTHQKLCYIRDDNKPFKYTIASLYPDFELGCIPLRDLAGKMPKTEISLEENQFVKELLSKKNRSKYKKD